MKENKKLPKSVWLPLTIVGSLLIVGLIVFVLVYTIALRVDLKISASQVEQTQSIVVKEFCLFGLCPSSKNNHNFFVFFFCFIKHSVAEFVKCFQIFFFEPKIFCHFIDFFISFTCIAVVNFWINFNQESF